MRIAWFIKEHRIASGVILFDLVIVVLLVVMMIMKAGKTATVDIMTVPSIAKVKIGGAEYSSGAYKIHPGDYEAEVKADGFVTKTVPVNARDGEISKVWVYLVPEEGGFDWYTLKDNYDEFEQLARIATPGHNLTTDQDESAEEFVGEFQREFGIFELLPIKEFIYSDLEDDASTAGFSIKDGRNRAECNKSMCLLVKYYGADYEGTVIEKIKEAGYDPVDYQLIYERAY